MPQPRLGMSGFRAWIAAADDDPRIARDARDGDPYEVERIRAAFREAATISALRAAA